MHHFWSNNNWSIVKSFWMNVFQEVSFWLSRRNEMWEARKVSFSKICILPRKSFTGTNQVGCIFLTESFNFSILLLAGGGVGAAMHSLSVSNPFVMCFNLGATENYLNFIFECTTVFWDVWFWQRTSPNQTIQNCSVLWGGGGFLLWLKTVLLPKAF